MLFKMKFNKIIILGINKLSLYFAKKFSKNFDVVILSEEESIDQYDIDAIFAPISGDLLNKLKEHEIEKSNLFLAITENEEYNLFAARLAGEYGVKKTIAMVYNPNYINLSAAGYIFNPYQLFIDKTNSMIKETRLRNIKDLIPGKVNVSEFTVNKKDNFAYKKVKNLRLDNGLIISIKRNNEMIIPDGDFELIPDDIIYLLYKKSMFSAITKQLSRKGKFKWKVFIIGGNELGYLQALNLKGFFDNIIIIESDLVNCQKLAKKSEDFLILQGEGIDKSLLLDEGLTHDSIIITLDKSDFHNLISSYLFKNNGCDKVITLLNDDKHKKIADLLGLKNIVSLPQLVTEHLKIYINTGHITNKYFLGEEIYTTKIKIAKDSTAIKKRICDLRYRNKIIVGVIIRNDKVIIPGGENYICSNDELLVFFYKNMESYIHNIFN